MASRASTTKRRTGSNGARGKQDARAAGQNSLPGDPGEDDADPALRGARRGDVREGEDRRLPAPVHRRGGGDRRRDERARGDRLPDVHLPRARPGDRARHAAGSRDGRALRQEGRLLGRTRRLDAPVRLRAPLPRRLRHRRRQPAARGRRRAGVRLPRRERRDAVHVRRRGDEPGHVRRDDEPGRALEAAGRLHGDQQPVRHGHVARAALRRHRPVEEGRGLRRAGQPVRRHGRAGHRGRDRRGGPLRARGAQAAARRGRHLPLPRPLDGRPGGVPHEGGGRGVAQARPDRDLRQAAGGRGRALGEGPREDRRGGDRRRSTRRSSSPTRARSPTSPRSTTTSTSTASR